MYNEQELKLVLQSETWQYALDFEKSYGTALSRLLRMHLLTQRYRLPLLAEALEGKSIKNQVDRGIQDVPLHQIVGSVSRQRDFDRHFHPLRETSKPRWISISEARFRGNSLPPVDLIKLGDIYFVQDGHHRVSVARFNRQVSLEAHVIEMVYAEATAPTSELTPARSR